MTAPDPAGFVSHDLGDGFEFRTGHLPTELLWDAALFDRVWNLHPAAKHIINMPGGPVPTPRWQQAYGADYYTGRTNPALEVPPVLEPLREWARGTIDGRLNGLLLNWYDGPGHYIGPHHDSTRDMIPDTPIVTISFGETRTFRLTREAPGGKRTRDFSAVHGTVFVLPFATNRVWKHAVPKSAKYRSHRISVTLRAFVNSERVSENGLDRGSGIGYDRRA